ncbi:ABC transporter permease [Mesorhizobium sp. M8A.F.Ca.ET.198.01.1.1]|uniref:ABC transporter permease n=1 Tax=Mesorhizobium sp. M8A.F.Ca.ET.198.01.1.1 TaxID=2563966 RepID=UPI000FD6C61F|nr:ABC transporter permease [Mesorhizobium sp. M8A.F.Ca.ET.198.01.1.1]TGR23025.1 ABC transporter permease [Mesorhizobium sp. M8A.F.Ca.ET.197.01.1.1]TGR39111.1 ABC transporter permease [bacterium M00.F.Ca.ET.199.01.1.1]TGR46704.1 ABC transporter permease [Mesorhizobium sp. M8A.F.Ca.ET.198.01.1.1]
MGKAKIERMAAVLTDFRRTVLSQPIALAAVGMLVLASLIQPNILSLSNVLVVLRQVAVMAIMAIGVTYVLKAGRIDLSIGSLLSLCTVTTVMLHEVLGPIPAMVIALCVGILSGCVAGFLVGYVRLNSLITTLGMMSILQGITLVVTGGVAAYISNPDDTWFRLFGRAYVLGIPVPVIIVIVLGLIFGLVLTKTVFGRHIAAVGGGEIASIFSAIDSRRTIFMTFVISGALTSIAAIVLASRAMTAKTDVGSGYELTVLAGVFLGGTSLMGGSGGVGRSLMGLVVLGFLANALIVFGAPYYAQWITQMVIIIAAVWFEVASRRRTVLA